MDIASGIFSTANQLGISPIDLATAISYETAGTFNPLELGLETKYGQHQGLIQFGEPQANQYGVSFETRPQAISTQLGPGAGIYQYLKAVGVKPGMGLDQIYSAINTGGINNFEMTDSRAGGMPGTVAEKVASMGDHKKNAEKFMRLAMQNQPSNINKPLNANPNLGAINNQMPNSDQSSGMNSNPLFKMLGKTVGGGFNKLKDAVTGTDPDASDRLAIALMSLSGNPQSLAPMMEMAAQDIKDRKTKRNVNQSLEYIRSIDPELAKLVENNPAMLQQVLAQVTSKKLGGNKTVMSADQLMEKYNLTGIRPGAYNVVLGKDDKLISYSATGQPDKNFFDENLQKGLANKYIKMAENYSPAKRTLAQAKLLGEQLAMVETGPVAQLQSWMAGFGIDTRDSFHASAEALISKMIPSQREPGSGPMSDADLDLYKLALPKISTTPGGNALIIQTMTAIAEYEMKVADIANSVIIGELSAAEAIQQERALADPLEPVRQFMRQNNVSDPLLEEEDMSEEDATSELTS